MADGRRAPIVVNQAGDAADLHWRAVLAGAVAAPAAARLGASGAPHPGDARLLELEEEFERLHAEGDAERDDDAAETVYAGAQAIEELVLRTPVTTPVSLAVKLRMMIRRADHSAPELAAGLRNLAAQLPW